MTDNEIIKALECCVKITTDCEKCPYWDINKVENCFDVAKQDALDLINRQKADYDKLYKSYLKNQEIFAEQSIENERLKAEIERLKLEKADIQGDLQIVLDNSISAKLPHCVHCGEGVILTKDFDGYNKLIADISAEAVKEFAKKVYDKRQRNVEGECVICEDDFFKAFEELGGKVSDVIDYY